MHDPTKDAVTWLRSPEAIRERCGAVLAHGLAGRLEHFRVDLGELPAVAGFVAEVIRDRYPALDVPYHSRWRHFGAGGVDRLAELERAWTADGVDVAERARRHIDLVVLSVLLDAGAGEQWSYREAETGGVYRRSEGLAVASLRMAGAGLLRGDADALDRLSDGDLAAGFQAGAGNPLVGMAGRADLLRRLAAAMRAAPHMFGTPARLGNLYDYLHAEAGDGHLAARRILTAVLTGLGPIWPGRTQLGGVNLGDVWPHPAAGGTGPSHGLVPLHKLSQWLTYSLIEPMEWAGVEVTQVDDLTGLAEYRNGGLFIDTRVLVPRHAGVLGATHAPGDEVVVEWRALTVALLERLADGVRAVIGLSASEFPLARVLEGGTWAAGRRLAAERRPEGAPPIAIASDGTVF
ncbi:MAG TPA: URC4/urg3 family protein [Kofleriaceae bacterium]|nr:URC4/urg3 family protein [Kofleriaceae bacterium]